MSDGVFLGQACEGTFSELDTGERMLLHSGAPFVGTPQRERHQKPSGGVLQFLAASEDLG